MVQIALEIREGGKLHGDFTNLRKYSLKTKLRSKLSISLSYEKEVILKKILLKESGKHTHTS